MSDELGLTVSSGWRRDAMLDPQLQLAEPLAAVAGPRRILLTGATGMLGAHLLDELLRGTSARLVCLVRAADPDAGLARLSAQLAELELAPPGLHERVRVVVGDLGEPALGLDAAVHAELAVELDAIVHAGAAINFMRPYAALRAVNVGGTEAVIRLAASGRRKAVHHVSSLAVFFGQARAEVSELDEPDPSGLHNGYAQSKWVAEQLVLAASARGLPTTITRTARIGGHSQTGATSSRDDLINRLIAASVRLGVYPNLDIDVGMIPVDFVTRFVVHVLRRSESFGRSFHLVNPRPVSWRELIGHVAACGYALTELDDASWRARLKRGAAPGQPGRDGLARLWMALASGRSLLWPRPRYSHPNSLQIGDASLLACPALDRELVARYVDFLVRDGYLPAPE